MATVDITKDTLQSTIEDNDIVLIDFWAEWCGPCRSFAPTYEAISEKYPNVKFAKVDTEAEQELAANFGIRSIPTLVAFRDQVGIFSQPGALPGDALEDLISQIEALDMDEIRKEIASEEADGSEAELGSEADGSEAELASEASETDVAQEASATT
ncbi:MAG: thioredoxin [Acidimicrobiia bacterium]|nr:MAG: thioredoxin [Acidimicrobiia bacterium]